MAEILDRTTLKALSTDTRQDIIKLLAKRPHTASEISKILDKHVTTVTEHLNVLEKSDLIKKKETTNKWVYYTLSGKGEKLFKPNYYSWVIVFAISAVFMFTGFLRTFRTDYQVAQKAAESAGASAGAAPLLQTTAASPAIDVIGIGLIVLAIVGFGYIGYKIMKSRRTFY